MTSKEIFISHATKDKDIAKFVVNCLKEMGINPSSQVFCTSLDGLGIPAGQDFKAFIYGQIQKPKLMVAIISQNYLDSEFCLAELGAAWALSNHLIPIVVPPCQFKDIGPIFGNVQGLMIEDKYKWAEVATQVADMFGLESNPAYFESLRDELFVKLPELLAAQPNPSKVSFAIHNQALKQKEQLLAKILKLNSELQATQDELTKVSSLKDAEAVKEILKKKSSLMEELEELADTAFEALSECMSATKAKIFLEMISSDDLPFDPLGEYVTQEDWDEAIRAGELTDRHGHLVANTDEPIVEEAFEAAEEVRQFIDKNKAKIDADYKSQFKESLDFGTTKFWKRWFVRR